MVLANIRKDAALLWVVFILVPVQSQTVTNPEASSSSITAKPLNHSETASHLTASGADKTNHQTSSGYSKAMLTHNNTGIITKPATPNSHVSLSAENEDASNTQTAVTAGMVSSHHTEVSETMKPTVQPSSPVPLITSLGPSATTSASKLAFLHLSATSKSSFTPTASTTTSSNAPSPIQAVKHTTVHTMTSGSPTTTNSTFGSISSLDAKTTSWPIKITEMSTKAEFSSTSHSQSSSMKISHSSTQSPVTITSSSSPIEATSTLSPTPTSTNSSVGVFTKTEFSTSPPQPSSKTTSTTTETALPFSVTSNSTNSSVPVFPLIPKMTTKSLPTARTLPPSEKPTEKGVQPCSTNHRSGVANQCLIAIAVLALIATIFMVSTVILCTKLSASKHRYRYRTRESQQGTELVCISALLPEKNCPYGRHTNPRSNGALLPSTEDDSDDDMDDNLTLNSFLPENDRFV